MTRPDPADLEALLEELVITAGSLGFTGRDPRKPNSTAERNRLAVALLIRYCLQPERNAGAALRAALEGWRTYWTDGELAEVLRELRRQREEKASRPAPVVRQSGPVRQIQRHLFDFAVMALGLAALMAMIWLTGRNDPEAHSAAMRAAAKPFEGHSDQITGPVPESVFRATGGNPDEGLEPEGRSR